MYSIPTRGGVNFITPNNDGSLISGSDKLYNFLYDDEYFDNVL